MQRYGLTRIYGRKGGDDHGRIERVLLIALLRRRRSRGPRPTPAPRRGSASSPSVATTAAVSRCSPASPGSLVARRALDDLDRSACSPGGCGRRFGGAPTANPAKWAYMGATIALVLTMFVDPVAGLMGYVAAHAIEYFVIVHQSLGRRYVDGQRRARVPLRSRRARSTRTRGFLRGLRRRGVGRRHGDAVVRAGASCSASSTSRSVGCTSSTTDSSGSYAIPKVAASLAVGQRSAARTEPFDADVIDRDTLIDQELARRLGERRRTADVGRGVGRRPTAPGRWRAAARQDGRSPAGVSRV